MPERFSESHKGRHLIWINSDQFAYSTKCVSSQLFEVCMCLEDEKNI